MTDEEAEISRKNCLTWIVISQIVFIITSLGACSYLVHLVKDVIDATTDAQKKTEYSKYLLF